MKLPSILLPASLLLSTCAAWSGLACAAGLSDPFDDLAAIPDLQETRRPCPAALPAHALTLADVLDTALCRNPDTASSWASARSRAAAVGQARSAYLPTLSASGSVTRSFSSSQSSGSGFVSDSSGNLLSGGSSSDPRYAASATLSYLLFDFGGRGAALDGARALLEAARQTRNASLQGVYLDAVTRYFAWASAEASLQAAREAERAAQSSFEAASTREQVGTVTRADRLQAQTALAQSQLARVQAEGALRTALGSLANVMGQTAGTPLNLAPAPWVSPSGDYLDKLEPLVAAALEARPDLAAAEANLAAAQNDVDAARAEGLPRLSANVSESYSAIGQSERDSTSAGVSVSVPIFSGFSTTYRIRAAEAQVEARRAERDRLRNQASLEVYQAHSELTTQTQSVFTAQALVAAAEESESVARGRYQAGVGTILDLINAQSSAADARRQLILARSNWAAARSNLAKAIGALDPASDPLLGVAPAPQSTPVDP